MTDTARSIDNRTGRDVNNQQFQLSVFVVIAVAAAGIIPGVISVSGLGGT